MKIEQFNNPSWFPKNRISTTIYILKLQGGRFYVGKTDNPMKRYQEHLNGAGSAWTRKYKPIGIEKISPNASPFDEDRYVKEYMNKYGIDKVRGGAYVSDVLPEFQEKALKSELWGATDKCTICGRKGHWANDCYAIKDVTGKEICDESESDSMWECEYCYKEFDDIHQAETHERICKNKKSSNNSYSKPSGACFRCGRPGHYAPDCYAGTHKRGYTLDSDEE